LNGVDGEDHAGTTVAGRSSLTAVCPYWGGIGDGEVPGREISGISSDGHESGVKASGAVGAEWATRVGERRLSDGVVLLLELEDNSVAGTGRDERWVEGQDTGSSNNDGVNSAVYRHWGSCGRARIRIVGRGPAVRSEGDGLCDRGRCWGSWDGIISIRRGCPSGGCIGSRGSRRRCSSGSFEASTNSKSGVLEVGERVGRTVSTAINGEDHSGAAMALRSASSLAAVNPDRARVVNGHSEGREVVCLVGSNWLESRADTTIFLSTRGSKGGLRHGMVLGMEMENHLIAGLSRNSFW